MEHVTLVQRFGLARVSYLPKGRDLEAIARFYAGRDYSSALGERGALATIEINDATIDLEGRRPEYPLRTLQFSRDGHLVFIENMRPALQTLKSHLIHTWQTLEKIATHARTGINGSIAEIHIAGPQTAVEVAFGRLYNNRSEIAKAVRKKVPRSYFTFNDEQQNIPNPCGRGVYAACMTGEFEGEISKIVRRKSASASFSH